MAARTLRTMTASALVRRDAVRLAQPVRETPAPPAPTSTAEPTPPAQGADTPCLECGCTKAECEGAGPCCEKCSHDTARAAPPAAAPVAPPESRVRSFIASDETVDRYNTVIKAAGWELGNFTRNPVILFGHEGRALPIGKGRAWVQGSQLRLDVEFLPADLNPLAEQALRILDQGLMGVSVGFNPIDATYNEDRETGTIEDLFFPPLDFTRTELLEVSVVTIPANPSALPVGRDLVEARMYQRATAPGARMSVHALARLVPGLVREAVTELATEIRASRARRTGRTN